MRYYSEEDLKKFIPIHYLLKIIKNCKPIYIEKDET